MRKYEPKKIEPKWQKIWEEKKLYQANLNKEPKFYCLVMFPYPSGDKLHIGHWYNYGPTDTYARFKKMQGFNVFEPIGFDAFGLPAENYAIKTGVHPEKSTEENIKFIRKQLKQIGAMYDWSKEIITSHPDYYKWTQWIFLQLYKNGLAYKKRAPANYCPSCKTVLANEQVIEGRCERCDSQVLQKDLEQWFFKITAYADRLLSGLKKLNWPAKTKIMQENWIGKSEGAVIKFQLQGFKSFIDVFTTRPDTLFGATYLVIAPEKWLDIDPRPAAKIQKYISHTKNKTYFERQFNKEKTGVFTGLYAINPATNEKIPIWLSDYVLPDYGTGAIMCVPAHDQRDFEFAKKFNLPIKQVIKPPYAQNFTEQVLREAYTDKGTMINCGKWDGTDSEKFKSEIVKWLSSKGLAKKFACYKLRDWLISRQRYWGAPIPIVYCKNCSETDKGLKNSQVKIDGREYAIIPVPEQNLPVLLPKDVDFKPSEKSPLATNKEFVNTKCPRCGSTAIRETDTMDTFVCSSWYFLRYLNPSLADKPWNDSLVKKWLPVDLYVGGVEHATMHLIYARFITKVLYDLGYIHFEEPFLKLFHQGTITHKGAKMSKSRGNVVIPDEFIKKYGSDSFRMYLMFMGPYDEGGDWSDQGIVGIYRFLNKVWDLIINKISSRKNVIQNTLENDNLRQQLHLTIKKVTEDIEKLKFNTAIASLMQWINDASNNSNSVTKEMLDDYVKLLAPFAPHIAEELWSRLGHKNSIFKTAWPRFIKKHLKTSKVNIVIQVNGKVRDKIEVGPETTEEKIKALAQNAPKVCNLIKGKHIKKIIYVDGRLVNIVV